MRYELFDENKIIKKSDSNNIQNKINIENVDNNLQNDIPDLNEVNKNNENENDNIQLKEEPIFVYKYDSDKNIVTETNEKNINIDIPKNQLRLIYNNALKYNNELKLDIEILKLLLKTDDDKYYLNKLEYLKKEIKYSNFKIKILNNLLK